MNARSSTYHAEERMVKNQDFKDPNDNLQCPLLKATGQTAASCQDSTRSKTRPIKCLKFKADASFPTNRCSLERKMTLFGRTRHD